MFLHRDQDESFIRYTFFDADERVVILPTHYLRDLRLKRQAESQRQIAYVLKGFCQWLEESLENTDVDEMLKVVMSDDILDWINEQRAGGISEGTIRNREVLVRELFKWLTTEKGGHSREEIPWSGRAITKNQHNRLPRFVTMEQVIALLNCLHNESQRVAAHFIFDTGLRVSELVRLTNSFLPDEKDWPTEANYYPLEVQGSKPYDGAKYKYRYTIVSRPMLARVRRYHSTRAYMLADDWGIYDPDKPVFLNVHGKKLTIDSVQKGIEAAWLRQGQHAKKVSPHRLRHGTAYSVLKSELGKELLENLVVLKSMLGHERIRTTETYTSIPLAALRSVAGEGQIQFKYEEAQQIYEATYLPEHMHKERRGHSK
jgi:integrase/recombinase XerC